MNYYESGVYTLGISHGTSLLHNLAASPAPYSY